MRCFFSQVKKWTFPLGSHENLVGALGREGVKVVPVPRAAIAAATLAVGPSWNSDAKKEGGEGKDTNPVGLCEKKVPKCMLDTLAPFQKEGVEFVLRKGGRAMIADEMGLGKTIQAIACAAAYRSDWPLLVIAPSSARFHWQHELLKWLEKETLTKEQVIVVCNSKQELAVDTKVVITSYELVNRMKATLHDFNFGVVVCDECHYLKNARAARTKAIVPLAKKAKRAIFLSGTPALSRPVELFMQLHTINAKTWANYHDFGMRYCSGKRGKFGWDFSGSSHIPELHALLRATIMVRRLKKDILKHLPPKQRSIVDIGVDDGDAQRQLREDLALLAEQDAHLGRIAKKHVSKGTKSTKQTNNQLGETLEVCEQFNIALVTPPLVTPPPRHWTREGVGEGLRTGLGARAGAGGGAGAGAASEAGLEEVRGAGAGEGAGNGGQAAGGMDGMSRKDVAQQRRSLLMKLFADTGTAKIPGVLRHVQDILSDDMSGKVLVFAHHKNVLDALDDSVLKKGERKYIRIDGRTKPKERQGLVEKFQNSPQVRIALLGLTAAGIGITLTAASRVVFAELYWTPAQLLQAEDRCHRIGQASTVQVEYLVAKESLDDALWPLIRQKVCAIEP
ncbi:unnamed protein product [Discosporangium mesarthrocarpum]